MCAGMGVSGMDAGIVRDLSPKNQGVSARCWTAGMDVSMCVGMDVSGMDAGMRVAAAETKVRVLACVLAVGLQAWT